MRRHPIRPTPTARRPPSRSPTGTPSTTSSTALDRVRHSPESRTPVERPRELPTDGRIPKPAVEPQRGLVELVDVERNLRDAAVAGPAVGFGHQSRGEASSASAPYLHTDGKSGPGLSRVVRAACAVSGDPAGRRRQEHAAARHCQGQTHGPSARRRRAGPGESLQTPLTQRLPGIRYRAAGHTYAGLRVASLRRLRRTSGS